MEENCCLQQVLLPGLHDLCKHCCRAADIWRGNGVVVLHVADMERCVPENRIYLSQTASDICRRHAQRQIFHIRLGSPQEEMRAFAVTQTSSPSGATGSCLPTLSFQMSFKERTNAVCDSLKICSFTWALQRVRLFACSLLMSCQEASEL